MFISTCLLQCQIFEYSSSDHVFDLIKPIEMYGLTNPGFDIKYLNIWTRQVFPPFLRLRSLVVRWESLYWSLRSRRRKHAADQNSPFGLMCSPESNPYICGRGRFTAYRRLESWSWCPLWRRRRLFSKADRWRGAICARSRWYLSRWGFLRDLSWTVLRRGWRIPIHPRE